MPPLAAAIAAYFAISTAMAYLLIVAAVITLASIGMMAYTLSSMPSGFSQELRNRMQVVRSSISPHRIIYGEVMVSGTLVYSCSAGENNKFLYLVIALAGHECEEIGDVYLGDTLSTDPKFIVVTPEVTEEGYWTEVMVNGGNETGAPAEYAQEWVVTRPYKAAVNHSFVQITKYLGTDTQTADPDLIADSGGAWTENHRLQGIAYIVARLEWDQNIFPTGIPNIKTLVKGNNQIYDPATGLTGYTNNWALCVRDYLVKPHGLGCTSADIDDTAFIAGRNISAEAVTLPDATTQPRYLCNGTFQLDQKPIDVMQRILSAGNGKLVWQQGKYRVKAAAYSAPTVTLTESDLRGKITVQTKQSKQGRFNGVKGTFADPAKYWQAGDFPLVRKAAYVAEDADEEIVRDIELSFTTDTYAAQRIGKVMLEKNRRGITVDFPGKFTVFEVSVGDTVRLSIALLGWVNKEFEVMRWALAKDGAGVDLVLQEEDSAVYDWAASEATVVSTAPATALPNPWQVASPIDLEVTETLYRSNTVDSIKTRGKFTWTPADAMAKRYAVQLNGVAVGETPDTSWTFDDLSPVPHRFNVAAINSLGVMSPYASIYYVVQGKTAPPSSVTGFQAEIVRGQMRLYWEPVSDLDVSSYEIRIGTAWDDAAVLVSGYAGTSYPWTPNQTGTINLLIKSIDTSGNYSTGATALVYTVVAAGAVQNLKQQVIDNIVRISWDTGSVGTFPVDYYEVRKGTDFASAESMGRTYKTFDLLQESLGGTYKYWLRPVDIAGLAGAEIGIYAKVDQPPDYVLQDQRDLEWANGTLANALVENGDLLLPVNTTETFQSHFTSHGWAGPQSQVTAGYDVFIQPGPATASYEEVIDYGATIAAVKVTVTVTRTTEAGTVTFTPTISTSPDGSAWTSLGNVYEAFAQNMRYVKVKLAAATSDGGVARVQQASVKLDVKEKTFATTVNVTDTVSDGTAVTFASLGIAPVDVRGITASAPYLGTAADPVTALVNFVDAANPTQFKVLAWDASGVRKAVNGVTVIIRYV